MEAGMRTNRTSLLLLLGTLTLALGAARDASALTACTAAQVNSQDPGCPAGTGPCAITKFFTVPNGCVLDFAARAVTVNASGTFDIAQNTVTIKAGSFTVAPGGLIDGRGTSAAPRDRGGFLTIQTTGNVATQKAGTSVGKVLFDGDVAGGTVRIEAGGSVTIADKLTADSATTTGAGGQLFIAAGTDIVSTSGSLLSAKGGDAGSGVVDLSTTTGKIDVFDIEITGKEGGILNVASGGQAILRKVLGSATGDAGSGGSVDIVGGTTVQFLDQILLKATTSGDGTFGGCGGELDADARFGDLTMAATARIDASGAAPDGFGGAITLVSTGAATIPAGVILDAGATGAQGCGGELSIDTEYDLSLGGTSIVEGGLMGGSADFTSRANLTISGTIDADGRSDGSVGGLMSAEAGFQGRGTLLISGLVSAVGVGCDTFGFCGQGGSADLFGCDLNVNATGRVLVTGPSGGTTSLNAREQLTVTGIVDSRKSVAAGAEGINVARYPSRKPAALGAGVTPTAMSTALATCTGPNVPAGCVDPCPTCGNGLTEWPETCDNSVGTPLSCDGCSAFCRSEVCSDNNVCTTDSCDTRLGCNFVLRPNGTSCSDGLVCNGTETCTSGFCTPANVPNCNDNNLCTADSCVEPTGCRNLPNVGAPCTDNNACTSPDTCNASGVCTAGAPTVCNDGNECTNDSCVAPGGCVATPRTGSCTDDGNPCTTDTCSASTCTHPARANGTSCSDGAFCTLGEACQSGVCSGGTPNCLDNNPCTVDNCLEASDTCSNAPATPGTGCTDNNACTVGDSCNVLGICQPGTTMTCDDGNECTTDTCNPASGCVFTPRTGACTDDGNSCTNDVCSGTACTHPARANGSTCSDGQFCTVGETCQAGSCGGGTPNCIDNNSCTVDSCDELNDACSNTPAGSGTSCTDNNACTDPDTCDGSGTCVAGPARVCDDLNECTNDGCNPASGCTTTPRTGACTDDGNSCTDDVCAASACTHPNRSNGTGCEDGDFCTVNDACQAGSCTAGPARSCADTNACTTDTCDETADACVHTPISPCCGDGTTQAGEDCDDGNTSNTDACLNNCSAATCGDGFVRTGVEQCDQGAGNSNAPDAACRTDCQPRRCGDGIVDTAAGEQCDSGGSPSAVCSATCFETPPPTAGLIAGKGNATTDCALEWAMIAPAPDKKGNPNFRQTCRDGDPACDFGTTSGECVFKLWLCSNNTDPRLPLCSQASAGTVLGIEFKKPNDKDAARRPEDNANRQQLLRGALAAQQGNTNACGPRLSIRVPLRSSTASGSKSFKLKAATTAGITETDVLKLTCTP
jgi:cysteine-rich repeat protein